VIHAEYHAEASGLVAATTVVEADSADQARTIAKDQCRCDGYAVRSLRKVFRGDRPRRWVVVHGVRRIEGWP
jgi:hypothetical protein